MKTQLFEDANKTHSLYINASMGEGEGERKFSKIIISLLQRDGNNKATCTVAFFLDMPDALAWFTLLSDSKYEGELSQYKEFGGRGRGRGIKILAKGQGIRIHLQEKEGDKVKSLYFDLPRVKALEAGLVVSAFVKVFFNKRFNFLLKGENCE